MQLKNQLRYDRVTLSIIVNSAQSFAFNYIAHSGAVFRHFWINKIGFGSSQIFICTGANHDRRKL